MPFSLTPTYQHSRRRAAASLAKQGDLVEAARIGRIRLEQLQLWLENDAQFQRLYRQAQRRARRRVFRRMLDPFGVRSKHAV